MPDSEVASPVVSSNLVDLNLVDSHLIESATFRAALANFVPQDATPAEQIAAIEAGLRSPAGEAMRDTMARWIVDSIVPVARLVPQAYENWRPPVRDAMMFVVARLSPARLAPKLLEQLNLPPKTTAEERLLRLIAKVPGLQKLGQVIARNQHLRPALRNALARLENGIRDVRPEDVVAIIRQELGPRIQKYDVKIAPSILSEASVSAVVRFTWRDPETGKRERGVFKVLKPHIPEYFAEDMDYLQGLAQYFSDRHRNYGFPRNLLPDTFKKVRRLLRHEVNFAREQKTLVEAWNLYRSFLTQGIRVPRLIRPLCTSQITALTEERGIKVTNAAARLPIARRRKIAEQLVEALVAVPLLAAQEDAIFHGDPHAGNLLYNNRTSELTIIDWALRERLSRDQRRHLALLILMVTFRDPVGAGNEVLALTQQHIRSASPKGRMVGEFVNRFIDELPAARMSSGVDAMLLLERLAMKGVKFPGPLIMLSKVMFTLDGILGDIVGSDTGVGFGLTIARHVAAHWIRYRKEFRSPLMKRDWIALQCSALLYGSRLWFKGEQAILDRLLPATSTMPPRQREA
ncbi:MAG: AarF/UbiB family protein [Terriglobales bacterium]|jgi:predicted unusual protein kinase regulating ubiquinone biosynthesis (AarF/ABC1/UbiB family)